MEKGTGCMIEPRYKRGDLVEKKKGDYTFIGRVAAAFKKLDSEQIRYVVQDPRGILMIMNEQQLESFKFPPGE